MAAALTIALGAATAAAQSGAPEPAAPPTAPTEADLAKAKQASDSRPWAKGVTPEEQQVALELFAAGNGLLRDAVFVLAAEKYRAALEHWDHPAIHYNLALALVNLDRPVEMFRALEKALAYGPAPLDQDKFDRATGFKILVERQLASVDLTCDTAGAVVVLDGQELFTAPGSFQGLVKIGDHTVVAKKSGYVSATISQKLGPQETFRLNVKLFTDEELTHYKRRFPTWLPWTTVAAGAVIAGVGVVFHAQASGAMADFDRGIEACNGCVPTADLLDKRNSAESKQALAITSYIVGGAALATGLTLVFLNRPQAYRIDGTAEQAPTPPPVAVAPFFGPGLAGLTARMRF